MEDQIITPPPVVAPVQRKEVKTMAEPIVLFELSEAEKAKLESDEKSRQALANPHSDDAKAADAKRAAMFAALEAKHKPFTTPSGVKIWRYQDLGIAAYTEVAINGGYLDPRSTAERPDLEVPTFGDPKIAVFKP